MSLQHFKGGVRAKGFIIFGERENMSWTTIYITGRSDFREEVRKKLEHSDQRYMPGFIESPGDVMMHDLYWLDGRTDLRTFKEGIGGKIIWKYRLRFFRTLEEFQQSQQAKTKNEFSAREREMIAEMQGAA